ncbi:MAG: hypothetical protein HKN90_00120, partial [Flavobacteriaceae bacterium]|nr:hypothetical protein [Flavobacteriaceae bacterium]
MCNFKNHFLFFSFFIFCVSAYTQEIPPFKSFTPDIYEADSQNWSISQDSLGRIYLANNAGLLTFNGAEWKLYNTPNGSVMRSVKTVGQRIYVGFYMGFGFYDRNSIGDLEYVSLSEQFENEILEDEEFWQIEHYKQWVLFRSLNKIYLLNTTSNTFQSYTSNNTINTLTVLDDNVFFQVSNEGIYTLIEGTEKLYIPAKVINNVKLVNMFSHDDGFIGVTEKNGLNIISEQGSKPYNKNINDYLNGKTV